MIDTTGWKRKDGGRVNGNMTAAIGRVHIRGGKVTIAGVEVPHPDKWRTRKPKGATYPVAKNIGLDGRPDGYGGPPFHTNAFWRLPDGRVVVVAPYYG